MSVVPDPPDPFDPLEELLPQGARLYRAFAAAPGRDAATFNPGHGTSRFSFFGEPVVPTLYLAQTDEAAVCEAILRDVPQPGGVLLPEQYRDRVVAAVTTRRELRLAQFLGAGLARLGVRAHELTDAPSREYDRTVAWGEAAHDAGFDGVVWMAGRLNTDRAYVLFGDRVPSADLSIEPDHARIFAAGPDVTWLIDFCATRKVDVLLSPL